ncbi:MAG: leucine-rich repeat protein [Clostridia bacterium]|nr:leucine-rich repeat protein [Clostridia bacterium]
MKLKKLLSIVLLFAMLVATLPKALVSAEENYTWEIDEYGTLTISGTGEISFGWEGNQPWADVRDTITSIVVNEGITSIGQSAFHATKYATSISIPNTVKTIGGRAFENCTHLQNVVLPENLEVIDWNAFYNCSSLTEITIPSKVTSIGVSAFSGCTSLKKAVFKCSLSKLPNSIFSDCISLEDVTLPIGLASTGNACFADCTSLKKIVLSETVTALGGSVFAGCRSLQEINTGNVLEYEAYVFSGCSALDTVTINETVKTIPGRMFENSGITHLVLPENLQTIEGGAFAGCAMLEAVNMPEKLTRLGGRIFDGCVSLKEFTMPKNITSIEEGFFKGCTSLSKVTLHDNVTEIGYSAFEDCVSLKSITLPKNLKTLGYWAFSGTGITEITIPASLTTAYYSHSHSFDEGSGGPFGGTNLETVYFEVERNEIPANLFVGASKLKNIDLSNIEKIGESAFTGCSKFVPVLTEKTTEIGNYAFANCTLIEDFEIPAWMEKIPDGLLMGTSIGYLVFPDTVKEIGANAYQNCKNLSYIEFSDSITDIGTYAFYGCTALDEIDIPGTVINIGHSAFAECSNLAKLTMHKGTQTLGGDAFYGCSLTEVRPSQTIRYLDDSMFNHNPVQILVVPRFCVSWNGIANIGNTFNPAISFVPANVENFDIWMYEDATIKGVEGTAGYVEANREDSENVVFEPVENGIEQLSFDKKNVEISLDETYDSAAIVTIVSQPDIDLTTNRTEMDGDFITFTSDNESVATVDSTGYVHAVGYGTANITISCDSGITDVLTVNVVRPSVGVSISSGYEKLSVGNTVTLTADTIPSGYEESYTWSSSDEEIATVTQEGVVTAIKEGTAIISVKGEYSGKSASCIVTVASENTLPYKIDINGFVVGCDVSLTETESGGNVIAALYDSNNRLLATNIYPAAENVRVDFNVLPTVDLTNAQIKVLWWNVELVKPVSKFRLVEIE